MEERFSAYPRLAAGLALALGLAVLGLVSLVAPLRGVAAPYVAESSATGLRVQTRAAHAVGMAMGDTGTMSHTAFLPLVAQIPRPNVWQGEYYANPDLSGDPEITTQEARVDYHWGDGGAPPGLPADRFSVRWSGNWDFEVGKYTFFVLADDGIRLWLDGQPLVDAWTAGAGTYQATVEVGAAGVHHLRLEYFENTGDAAIRLHWRRTDLYPQWHGDYYSQPWVESGWQYAQKDPAIQFEWGLGCPAGLPCDSFSVSWTARRLFEPGTHRVFLYADEGYQLYVDDGWVQEGGWDDGQAGGAEDTVVTLEATGLEYHEITYNMHDRGTLAEARLWIEYAEQPEWRAEYFANPDLSGAPALTKYENAIFYDWGLEKARPHLPSGDQFSVRWSGQRQFHAGCYRFGLFADDGVRLWVDGERLVDQWHSGRDEYYSPATYLSAGVHEVIVEYYESTGEAEIRFWWE